MLLKLLITCFRVTPGIRDISISPNHRPKRAITPYWQRTFLGPGGFTTFGECPKWVFVSFKFADGMSKVEDLQYDLCQKLDNVSTSLMRGRHLISNTNYPTKKDKGNHLHLGKWQVMKTPLGSSPSVVTPPDTTVTIICTWQPLICGSEPFDPKRSATITK